ncbi:MAG TPA: MBOAT family O-acyltransferase [Candidatus Binatia bacterium]|nr:MBOAT family O-acyltransferase [Candidatus Binatia bacterium]
MALISPAFAGFVLAALAVYYALPGRGQQWWLLACSYLFCLTWGWTSALVLVGVTVVDFAIAVRLRPSERGARWLLRVGVTCNILALVAFRHAGPWSAMTGSAGPWAAIGLSFYALQGISYLIDVQRGDLPAERDPVAFALYMAYFPKLLAGPIERARTFLPDLACARDVDDAVIARSVTLIVIGLVRKIVIADTLAALIPPSAFTTPALSSALAVCIVTYAFALYNDFAGYTSLVRGVSGLFGIELSPNFVTPFFARNFTEFWSRWHITLSHWLRDYIYLPLSRALLRRNLSRYNVANIVLPPLVSMLVCGAWHGPAWNMLVWGGLHGTYLAGERLLRLGRAAPPPQQRTAGRQAVGMAVVFTLAVFAAIPFRMDLGVSLAFLRGLLTWRGWGAPDPRVVLLLAVGLSLDWTQYRAGDELVFLRWSRLARASLLAAAVAALLLVPYDGRTPFVYQGF